jgi:malonyl-CoA O-methyltransferase
MRAPWWSHRRWRRDAATRVADSRELADGVAGLLWANMALHASRDAAATIAEWHRLVQVDGFLMFSSFGPDTLIELRRCYAAQGWPAPAQAFVDMHDIGDALVHAGFADPVMDQEHLTLTWPGPRELLAELRALGGNLSSQRASGLRTPRWRAQLEATLVDHARTRSDGRVALSFEIVYGHAFRAPTRLPVAARTEVGVEELRAMARRPRRGP